MYTLILKNYKLLVSDSRWTNCYGLSRSILAFGTLLTLVFNSNDLLFKTASGVPDCPSCVIFASKITIYCLLKPYSLEVARLICIIILLLVISGWRPRITGILHWWVSFSLASTALVLDGGDQVTNILTLLLIPVCLTDNRKWHWDKKDDQQGDYKKIIANTTFIVIQLQVAFIYYHAAVGKLQVIEWVNGTALYYWLQDPLFTGDNKFIISLFKSPFLLTSLTWATLLFELLLFCGLFTHRRFKRKFFISAVLFHFVIMILFGLVSFFCAMTAALILYLLPTNREIQLQKLCRYPFLKRKPGIKTAQIGYSANT